MQVWPKLSHHIVPDHFEEFTAYFPIDLTKQCHLVTPNLHRHSSQHIFANKGTRGFEPLQQIGH